MYFDSMQMHEEEFSINPEEDFDDNHWFVRPKIPLGNKFDQFELNQPE